MAADLVWTSLRDHISRANALLEQGQFDDALKETARALELDPGSAAAATLADRIKTAQQTPASHSDIPPAEASPQAAGKVDPLDPRIVRSASWQEFQERVRTRRAARCLEAAVAALDAGNYAGACDAIREASTLDPHLPALGSVIDRAVARLSVDSAVDPRDPEDLAGSARLESVAAAPAAETRSWPWLVAASIVLAAGGGGWLWTAARPVHDLPPAVSIPLARVETVISSAFPVAAEALPVSAPAPAPPEDAPSPLPPTVVAGAANMRGIEERPVPFSLAPELASDRGAGGLVEPPPPAEPPLVAPAPTGTGVSFPGPERPPEAIEAPAPASTSEALVKETLSFYQRAFGALDAQAARAIWPSVDEPALARAFGDLKSQTIEFDRCEIDVSGPQATAACRGRATYVPRVGTADPRTETRHWTFTLSATEQGWTIRDVEVRR